MQRSRPAPEIAPVIKDGVEYSVSPQPEWRAKKAFVYLRQKTSKQATRFGGSNDQIKLNPQGESDVQDVCVSSMRVSDGQVQIRNEKGDEIKVDLARRKVIAGQGTFTIGAISTTEPREGGPPGPTFLASPPSQSSVSPCCCGGVSGGPVGAGDRSIRRIAEIGLVDAHPATCGMSASDLDDFRIDEIGMPWN